MKTLVALSFFLIAFISCKTSGVLVKLKNNSSEDFKKLTVRIMGQEFNFDGLRNGATAKVNVKQTYPYCYARAITSIDTVIAQPIDFVGETLFTHGKVIMRLSIYQSEGGKRYLRIN
jgi:hypothetical protein